MELRDVLLRHAAKYPHWELRDAWKLVYQNEFGCGHFLDDADASLARLTEEWSGVPESPGDACEDVGNGYCRLHLAPAKAMRLSPNTLNRFFVNTANARTGTVAGFEEKLRLLGEMCAQGALSFDPGAFAQAVARHKDAGYPAVSHSAAYRARYAPAYRLVDRAYCEFLSLFARIDARLREKPNPVIAIDGNASAGKTTLADLLASVYDCNIVRMDHFFLPPEKRTDARLREVGGNVDYERFYDEVIAPLGQSQPFSYRVFDCSIMDFCGQADVDPLRPTVVEGSYSHHPHFQNPYDLTVFLAADLQTQKRRIRERNGAAMLKKFVDVWIPMENAYFDAHGIRESSDLVF
ncbi:MAG: uridine kinase family protein [Christensenellales bacterium]|jgi:uridine kinase